MNLHTAPRRRFLALAAALGLNAALPLAALADTYPSRPVKLVVGYAAGGATDIVARLVALKLGEQTGQSFIVDNRSGANSNVGAEVVTHSPADGYTLYLYTSANTINASLYSKLGYDPQKDFEPVGMIAKVPNILVVNPKLPVHSLADYVRYAKEQPKGVTFASSGSGSSIHLAGETFKLLTQGNMLHVPYRGSAPAVSDLLGGQVDSMFDNAPSALPHVKGGRLRAIAVTAPERLALLPDVPTVAESGYPGFDVQAWFALAAPAGTPKPVVDKINAELNQALATPDLRKRLADLAAKPEPGTPEQLRSFAAAEIARWRGAVKASGARAD